MSKPKHYIDNDKFTEEVIKYAEAARDAIESDEEPPPMNDYIGQSLLDIATNMSNRANFIGYSYKEEFIGDALEDCIKYLKNFDPAKANGKPSAFSYVSRVMWFAFLRRRTKEERQHVLKQNMVLNAGIIDDISNLQEHDNKTYENQYLANIKSMADDYYKLLPDAAEDEDGNKKIEDYKKPSDIRQICPETGCDIT